MISEAQRESTIVSAFNSKIDSCCSVVYNLDSCFYFLYYKSDFLKSCQYFNLTKALYSLLGFNIYFIASCKLRKSSVFSLRSDILFTELSQYPLYVSLRYLTSSKLTGFTLVSAFCTLPFLGLLRYLRLVISPLFISKKALVSILYILHRIDSKPKAVAFDKR